MSRTGSAEVVANGLTGRASLADVNTALDTNETIARIDRTTQSTNSDLPLAF